MQLKWQISFLIYSFKWLSGNVSLPVHTAVSWVGVERPHALMIRATIHLLRKCWKHLLHKLAFWRLENSIPRSWFEHLGEAWLERKDLEAFGGLMSVTSGGHYRFLWPCALWTAQLKNTSISQFWAHFDHLHTYILRWSIGHFSVKQLCCCLFLECRINGDKWWKQINRN